MPLDNFTDITMILDRSGSMSSIQDATIKGFNDFVNEQKGVPGEGCWSLVQFDDQYDVVYAGKNQNDVPLLTPGTFQPRGSTALVDAVCRTIDQTEHRLSTICDEHKPTRVLLVILTDGYENASREYTTSDLNAKIARKRDIDKWQFIFLGANQDAIASARQYGIPTRSAMTYQASDEGTRAVFARASAGTRRWKLEGNESAADLLIDPADGGVNININVDVNKNN